MTACGALVAQQERQSRSQVASGDLALSDGIERMPRRLTAAEHRGDRLFLHLQIISLALPLFISAMGGLVGGWIGVAVGLLFGWLVGVWIRRSLGLRASDPWDGFLIRMRERANGSRPGLLEALVENVRRRRFTREQCVAITLAWEETCDRLACEPSPEAKRRLILEFDAALKRISYDDDAADSSPSLSGANAP